MEKKNWGPLPPLIGPHGGYENLKSYQTAEIVFDATAAFCDRFIDRRSRTHDQMVQASRKTELQLVGVARGSLEELLLDYRDFLRHKGLSLWPKDHPAALAIRRLAYVKDRSYGTYRSNVESGSAEVAANTLICLIHQANYLLDQQLRQLEKQFLEEGGFTERLYQARQQVKRGAGLR
jgi:four helix bundle suffix protein